MTKKLSKSEKRALRKAAKKDKQKEQNQRLIKRLEVPDKKPRITQIPPLKKDPRIIHGASHKEEFFYWTVEEADREGEWSWGESRDWTDEEYTETLQPCFDEYSKNTWQEVEQFTYNGAGNRRLPLNKYQSIDSIIPEAQERWLQNETYAQFEQLFRCRLGSLPRVWGIRVQQIYYIVWYDRHHNVCPVNKE